MSRKDMNDALLERYSRQLLLSGFDVEGQERLRRCRALIVGCGGLGSAAALYLGAAGCGRLWLADGDVVEVSNLQRQVAHTHVPLGANKAHSLVTTLAHLNPDCQASAIPEFLDEAHLQQIVAEVDIVLDCSDRFAVRDAVNRAVVRHRRILVSGAAIRDQGQLAVFDLRRADSPCYRCLYPDLSTEGLRCHEAGVLGPLVGVIGSLQALEAVKLVAGYGETRAGLLVFNAGTGEFRFFGLKRQMDCPVCRDGPTGP